MRAKLLQLPADVFDGLLSETSLERMGGAARAVLVDRRAQVEVAAAYGVTKQAVNAAVRVIERAYFARRPPGAWVAAELPLPAELADELDLFSRIAEDADPAQVEEAMQTLMRALITARRGLVKSGRPNEKAAGEQPDRF